MRIPIIAANWKMHHDSDSARAFIRHIREISLEFNNVEMLIAPPFTLLASCHELIRGMKLKLAGQNLYPAREGAFTGEVSPLMLRDAGCEYVIVGHSERRQYFQESDEFIAAKLKVALEHDLKPILCVGETIDERKAGKAAEIVRTQLEAALDNIKLSSGQAIVVAYEPVWAIGTGETASPKDAQTGASLIRDVIRALLGSEIANQTRIQYGGSVKPGNAAEILSMPDVDGALVGGASLDPDSFWAIVQAVRGAS